MSHSHTPLTEFASSSTLQDCIQTVINKASSDVNRGKGPVIVDFLTKLCVIFSFDPVCLNLSFMSYHNPNLSFTFTHQQHLQSVVTNYCSMIAKGLGDIILSHLSTQRETNMQSLKAAVSQMKKVYSPPLTYIHPHTHTHIHTHLHTCAYIYTQLKTTNNKPSRRI